MRANARPYIRSSETNFKYEQRRLVLALVGSGGGGDFAGFGDNGGASSFDGSNRILCEFHVNWYVLSAPL